MMGQQLIEVIRSKYTELQQSMNDASQTLKSQIDEIVLALADYEDDSDKYFPFDDFNKDIEKIKLEIKQNIQLDIKHYFFNIQFSTFDQNLKFKDLQLKNRNRKIVQTSNFENYVFGIVQSPINAKKINSVTFNIDQLNGDVAIGMCDLELMKAHKFSPILRFPQSGAYVLFQDGFYINTEDFVLNWNQLGFVFEVNSKIKVTYDEVKKAICFTKLNTDFYRQFNINNHDRKLSVCVALRKLGTSVTIVE